MGRRFLGGNWKLHGTRAAWVPAALLAAAASLALAPISPALTGISHAAAMIAITALLIWGPRRQEPLHRTRWFLVAALIAGLISELMLVAYVVIAGHRPASPWAGDVVANLYAPLTIIGLLLVPLSDRGSGHRVRALTDGVFAAASLWYLVASIGVTHGGHAIGLGSWSERLSLLNAAVDVCVVATGLTVLSRCSLAVSRTVAGIVLAITLLATDDIWVLLSGRSGYDAFSVLLVQAGLLVLLFAAALPVSRSLAVVQPASGWRRWLGILPFLPMLACVGVTLGIVLRGEGMPQPQVLPALVVGTVLAARQFFTSRERQHLVDQLRLREASLQAELRRDALTGLANRLALMERLAAVLADRRQWPVAIAVLDLDDFKFINDNHGHAVGDDILRAAARRLTGTVRAQDLIVRLGGDEFAVVSTRMAPENRDAFGDRLLRAFDDPIDVSGKRFSMSASVGIVTGEPPETPGELLAHADAAMYRAKEEKEAGSTVAFLDAGERSDIRRQLLIREAIAEPELDQFYVHYQPVVDLRSGRIIGFESLLRWHHPELGTVRPDVFIPLAERAGSIGILGDYVLATAAGDLARIDWRHPGSRPRVGVNVSPHQLTQPDFAETFLAQLAAHGLPPERLTIEITEQTFAQNLRPVEAAVDALAGSGIHIAVDDFGTGYSTMRYLQRLRPSILKIDRSFVADVVTNPASHKLVAALATMALTLGMRVVAEGIETPEQLTVVRQMGCELGQGFLFSPAVPIGEVESMLECAPWELGDAQSVG